MEKGGGGGQGHGTQGDPAVGRLGNPGQDQHETSPTNSVTCQHERFHFGSGGYYIFCSRCSLTWVANAAEKGRDDELDLDRGSKMGHTNEGLVRESLLQLVREQKNRQAELHHKVVLKREEFEKLAEALTLENKSMMDCGQDKCNRELLPPGCLTHLNTEVTQLQATIAQQDGAFMAMRGLLEVTQAEIAALAGALSEEGQANLGADAVKLLRKFTKTLGIDPTTPTRSEVEDALVHSVALGHAILDPETKCPDCIHTREVFMALSKEWKHGQVLLVRKQIGELKIADMKEDAAGD